MTAVIAADGCTAKIAGLLVYRQDFEASIDSWSAISSSTTVATSTTRSRSGTTSLRVSVTANGSKGAQRTITGLTVGASYTVVAWVLTDPSQAPGGWIEVQGIGAGPVAVADLTGWAQASYTFTATATSHTVWLWASASVAGVLAYWDDVSVYGVGSLDLPVTVKGYSATLDEGHSPYADATLTIVTPSDSAALALLDPTTNRRVQLTLSKTGVQPVAATATRTFDLRLRSSTVNAADGTMTLGLSSDETALLISGKGGTAVDTTYNTATDLRTLVGAILTSYGYTLAAGTVTADITRTISSTNLFTDPAMSASAGGGYGVGNATLDSNDLSWDYTGNGRCFNVYSPTSTDSYLLWSAGGNGGMTPGKSYTLSATGRVKVASTTASFDASNPSDLRTRRLCVIAFNATYPGGYVLARSGSIGANTAGTTSRVSVSFTLPADTTSAQVRAYHGYGSGSTEPGQTQWDGFRLSETSGLVNGTTNRDTDYFDGSGSVPADAHYATAWTGTANASTSTRTKLDSRNADALSRKPGTTAWEWLNSMISAAGLRLFCDEQRVWRLVDNSYAVDGTVTLTQAYNLTDGADTIDIGTASSGDAGYVEQVVVHYSWLDAKTAASAEAWDSAGVDGGITLVVERTSAYPGPGAAAAILARMQGRKRTLSLKGLTDLKAAPGMDAAATLPTTIQVGKVSSVTFGDDDEMTVGTRGLVQTPANAWLFAAGAWSAATGSWAAATGTN